MIKYIYYIATISLSALFTSYGFAAESPYVRVGGNIHSYDKSQVNIIISEKKFAVPRSSILPNQEIKVGKWVNASIPRLPASKTQSK